MATGDQAQILFVSTEHFLSLICHICWQCWRQHVLRPVSLSKDSSSSKRTTAESVWLHVSPTKSPAKFCLWNSRGWRWSGKQEKGSVIFRSQLEAAGLRVRGSISWLINGGIYGMDVIGMTWLWKGAVTFLLQTVQNSSTPWSLLLWCTVTPMVPARESSDIETADLLSHLPLVCSPFVPNAKMLVDRILHVTFVAQTFPLASG